MSHNANDIFDPQRYGLITGSQCDVLFPEKGNGRAGQLTYAEELANQMYFRFYDDSSNWQTEHGHLCESSAFEYYQSRYDSTSFYQPGFKRMGDFGGSADCLTLSKGVDFKCPTTLKGWLKYLHKGIDKQQYYQAQMYMWLYDREQWDVCAFLMETDRMSNNGITYPVPIDKRMIITSVTLEEGFAEKLINNAQFTLEQRDIFYNNLKQQFDGNQR